MIAFKKKSTVTVENDSEEVGENVTLRVDAWKSGKRE